MFMKFIQERNETKDLNPLILIFHWLPQENKKDKVKGHRTLNNSKGFHTYAVEWDKDYFKIYYNNLLVSVYESRNAERI